MRPALFEGGEKMQLTYNIANTLRAIGTKLVVWITRKFGMSGFSRVISLCGCAALPASRWAPSRCRA